MTSNTPLHFGTFESRDEASLIECGVRNGFDYPRTLWQSFLTHYVPFSLRLTDDQGQVRGFLICSGLHVLALAVDEPFRRQGYARRMIQDLQEKRLELFLQVRVSNVAAKQLYQSLDFIQTGELENYYVDPVENAHVMVWTKK